MAEKRKVRLPFLQSLPDELGKLTSAIEDDARKLIQEDIPAVHEKRKTTFAEARRRITEDVAGSLTDVSDQLDSVLDALTGDNGAPKNPISGDSSGSPDTKAD